MSVSTFTVQSRPDVLQSAVIPGKYYHYITDNLTWNEANKNCKSKYKTGQLVKIESYTEQTFLLANSPGWQHIWIGLSDALANVEGEFTWRDGSGQTWSSQKTTFPWNYGEPNNLCKVSLVIKV